MPPMQRRNPIRFLPHEQLTAAAEIPHVAAYLSLQSCERVAQALPQPLLPSAQVGSEHPAAGSSPGQLCAEPTTNFFSKSVCTSLQFHHANCMSYYRTGEVERKEWKSFRNDLKYFT